MNEIIFRNRKRNETKRNCRKTNNVNNNVKFMKYSGEKNNRNTGKFQFSTCLDLPTYSCKTGHGF